MSGRWTSHLHRRTCSGLRHPQAVSHVEHRRTGVARALLEEACAMLRDQGLRVAWFIVERKATSDAENHFGPLSLYLSSGFSIVKEQDDGLVVVRRSLL